MSTAASSRARRTQWRAVVVALTAGIIFAAGLTLGGMTDPRKVQGFLDIGGIFAGRWDPSLAFVMGGALLVSLVAFATVNTKQTPWASSKFELPSRRDIDTRLVTGAVLFGIGWGIAGLCPGPAFASLLTGGTDVLFFVVAMLVAMIVAKKWVV